MSDLVCIAYFRAVRLEEHKRPEEGSKNPVDENPEEFTCQIFQNTEATQRFAWFVFFVV